MEQLTKTLRWLVLIPLLLVALVIWSAAAYEVAHGDRIFEGVSALGVKLGGMNRAEAQAALQPRLAQPQTVFLYDGSARYALTPAELGIRLDADTVVDAAFAVGRAGDWAEDVQAQAGALLYGRPVSGSLLMDEGVAQVALKRLARQIERAPRDASVALAGSQVVASPSVTGRALDAETTIARIRQALEQPDETRIEADLAARDVPPVVRDAAPAAAQLRAILASPLRLTFAEQAWNETGKSANGLLLAPIQQERVWTLDGALLAGMLSTRQVQGADGRATLAVVADDAQLKAFLSDIARQIDRSPRDARFYFDEKTGKLTPLVASQDGAQLDVAASMQALKAQWAGDNHTVPLAVKTTKPAIALADADKFNIHELVVAGTTSFKGSSPERVKNIVVASTQFKGIVVAPGQEFSFNEYLGDVVDALGYEPAYVIIGDRTDVGIGGGVCQVSTTAFRAAFFGGYKITQRWAHGYVVHYYEPPIGLDATVFAPNVDFRFVNDTPDYLLIQPSVDLKESTLTFKFFGTANHRTVEMDGPTITKVTPHGPDIYDKDPTLPVGVTKQVDFAVDGKTVVVKRTVKDGDKVLYRDTFNSNYRPWQARFLVGTRK